MPTFNKGKDLLEWVAAQLPNLPHIQSDLKSLAAKVDVWEKADAKAVAAIPAPSAPVTPIAPLK